MNGQQKICEEFSVCGNKLSLWRLKMHVYFPTTSDLYGLFLFLGVEPYYRKTWWKKLLHEPFMSGNSKPLSDVLYNVMWRTAKKDVIGEVCMS